MYNIRTDKPSPNLVMATAKSHSKASLQRTCRDGIGYQQSAPKKNCHCSRNTMNVILLIFHSLSTVTTNCTQ